MRTRNSILNIIFSLIHKIATILLGFVVARLILTTYGSSINGMLASIRQFVAYLSLLEMGIAGASIYALYKPLAERNDKQISQVLVEAKNYYFRSGIAFTIGCIILAVIYTFIVSDREINSVTVFLVFIILSVSTAMDFFAFAKYRVIFTADQKEYIINVCNTIYIITYSLLAILAIKADMSIIIMQLTVVIAYFVRSALLYTFYKKTYRNRFDLSIKPKDKLVKQKGAVMWHEISWLVISSTPMVVMTLFYSFKQISVYSVYNMVIGNIVIIVSVFYNAFTAGFGEIVAKEQYSLFGKIYHQFEFMYFTLAGFMFLCTLQLIQPFINIFTIGVLDIYYNNPVLVILMILLSLANCFRVPPSIIIGITGSYQQTMNSTIIVTILCIILSVSFAFINFELILVGSITAYIIRAMAFMIQAKKLSIGYNINISIKNVLVAISTFIITYFFTNRLVNNAVSGYLEWAVNAFMLCLINASIYIILMMILNRKLTISAFQRLKAIMEFKRG